MPIVVSPSGKTTSFSESQQSKVVLLISFTFEGITIFSRPKHSRKALSPIDSIVSGSSMFFIPMHPAKQF